MPSGLRTSARSRFVFVFPSFYFLPQFRRFGKHHQLWSHGSCISASASHGNGERQTFKKEKEGERETKRDREREGERERSKFRCKTPPPPLITPHASLGARLSHDRGAAAPRPRRDKDVGASLTPPHTLPSPHPQHTHTHMLPSGVTANRGIDCTLLKKELQSIKLAPPVGLAALKARLGDPRRPLSRPSALNPARI